MAMASASGSALCFTDASSSRAIRRDCGSLFFAPRRITFGFVDKSLKNVERLRSFSFFYCDCLVSISMIWCLIYLIVDVSWKV